MSFAFGSQLQLGGWPNIGSGAEFNGAFTQAGAAALNAYAGFIGKAPRTWVRTANVIPASSAIVQFALIRQVGGAATLAQALAPTFRPTDVPQALTVGGTDKTVLTGTQHILFGFPVAFTGNFNLTGSDFLGVPLILYPGDGLFVLASTNNIAITLTANLVETQ